MKNRTHWHLTSSLKKSLLQKWLIDFVWQRDKFIKNLIICKCKTIELHIVFFRGFKIISLGCTAKDETFSSHWSFGSWNENHNATNYKKLIRRSKLLLKIKVATMTHVLKNCFMRSKFQSHEIEEWMIFSWLQCPEMMRPIYMKSLKQ